jgi:hypothetical protein
MSFSANNTALEGLGRGRDLPSAGSVPLRSDVRNDPRPRARAVGDRIAVSSYLGKGDAFDWAIADFSTVYADQNEQGSR